jgi:hypothetical protein
MALYTSAYPASFREQFNSNVRFLAARQPFAFSGKGLDERKQTSAFEWHDQLGGIAFADRTTRTGADATGTLTTSPTVFTVPAYGRRGLQCSPKTVAVPIDKADEVRGLTDPASKHAQNVVYAYAAAQEAIIINALAGNAYEATGTPPSQAFANIALPAAQAIGVQYGGTVNTGLTLAKLLRVRELLSTPKDAKGKRKFFVYDERQLTNLLTTMQVTSADYAAVRALVDGTVSYYLGMDFIKVSDLPLATGVRTCFGYTDGAIIYSKIRALETRIDVRPDLNYATQVWAELDEGAVRSREDYVVSVACDESV